MCAIKCEKLRTGGRWHLQNLPTGTPLLIGNPQLGWGNTSLPGLGIYQWMEANLVVGNPTHPRINASGVTFIGAPFMAIGFNDYLGWTHTNNVIKNADLYELKLASGGGSVYVWGHAAEMLA